MPASQFNSLALGAVCAFLLTLLTGLNEAEAKGPKGAPKKAPAVAKSGPKARPLVKPGKKTKPLAKPAKGKRPHGTPIAARNPFPRKKATLKARAPRGCAHSYLLPPVYLGQARPHVQPRLIVARTIYSSSKHVNIVASTGTPEVDSEVRSSSSTPDLAVTEICAESNDQIDSNDEPQQITATLENLGGAAYRSDEGAQVLVLYKNGELVDQRDFDSLEIGQTLNLTVQAEPESAVYEARVLFADDLRGDGNPSNDDMNPRNGQPVEGN